MATIRRLGGCAIDKANSDRGLATGKNPGKIPKSDVTDDPKQIGPVDVVLFAVKLWDTEMGGQ